MCRSIHVTTAADTMQTPTTHSPSRLLPVASERTPVTYGATNPERLPSELISAIPAAAAAPVRYAVGSAQKDGNAASTPQATDRDGEDREPRVGQVERHRDREAADERGHRHPDRRARRGARQTIMATSPTAYGIAVIRPCCTVEKVVPYWAAKPFTIVGRKKPSAYSP